MIGRILSHHKVLEEISRGEKLGDINNITLSPLWGMIALSPDGGPPVTLCDQRRPTYGGSWGPDDVIYFCVTQAGLFKVPAAGGIPQSVTTY
jgi:hypothetical protein